MTAQEQAKQTIADFTQFLAPYSLEDKFNAHARERIEALGDEVP